MRYFKERGIRYQFIDMKEKGMSKGEYVSVKQAVGGIENLLDRNGRDRDTLALIEYISDEDKGFQLGSSICREVTYQMRQNLKNDPFGIQLECGGVFDIDTCQAFQLFPGTV